MLSVKINPSVHRGDEIGFRPGKLKDECPNLMKAGSGFV